MALKLYGPGRMPRRVRAAVTALPRRMRAGQHGAHPEEYPLLWVVMDGDTLAAYATAYETEAGILSLRGCQVEKKYQGRGLQRRLLGVRVGYARRHGMRMARTYVAGDNVHSMCNVLRAGFEPARVTDGFLELERKL